MLEKRNFKELFLVASNHFIELFTTLIITKIISVNLSKQDFGFYSLILSILALISILPFTSLQTAIERYIIEYKDKNVYEKKFVSILFIHVFFFVLYLIVFVFFLFSGLMSNVWKEMMPFFIPFVIVRIYKYLLLTILNIERKRKYMIIARIVDVFLQVCIVLIYIFYNKNLTVNAVLISSFIGNLLCVIILLLFERSQICLQELNYNNFIAVFKDVFNYSIPLIIWGVFLWSQNMIGRWYIDVFLGKVDVANYSTMSSLSNMPSILIIALVGQFVVPIAYAKETNNKGYIKKINNLLLPLSVGIWIVIIIFTYLFRDLLIKIFLDKKYLDVSWSLALLMIGTAIYSTGQILIYGIYYYKKPKLLLWSNVFPGIFAIIVGYFLVKEYAYKGAILTNVLSNSLSGLLTLLTVYLFNKKNI